MKLIELLQGVSKKHSVGDLEREVLGLTHDSRRAEKGFIFFALPGLHTDGNRHLKEALSKGIVAVVSELDVPPAPYAVSSAWIQVEDALMAMAQMAGQFYGRPSQQLQVVGITGTNGKTTTSYYLESIFKRAGIVCGVIGTVNYRVSSQELSKATHTTPLSLDLERMLLEMLKKGATHVAMEVSSHSLSLKRVEEITFKVGVFTNLHRDHLDYHKTREDYFMAKAHLFELLRRNATMENKISTAVLNIDDPCGFRLSKMIQSPVNIVSYGFSAQASWRAEKIREGLETTNFLMQCGGKRRQIKLKLVGQYNVYNALAAAATANALGISFDPICEGLEELALVPGRLEAVRCGQDFYIFVDYAHTDSALEQVLLQLNRLKKSKCLKKIITVFGCGGDRDKTKRGPMGTIACQHSDLAIITSDNPRSEDPLKIIKEIETGIQENGFFNYEIQPDRFEAIHKAIESAHPGDVVLVAGKGHEDYQILKDRTIHFDDREVAAQAIKLKLG